MKKTMAILCAAALLCGAITACAKGKNESSSAVQTLEKLSFKAADISMSESFDDITNISRDPSSGNILVFGCLANGSYAGYLTDHTFSDHEELRFTPQEGEEVKYAALMKLGKKAILTVLDGKTLIYLYDSNNKLEKTIDCGDVLDNDTYATLVPCEDGIIINEDRSDLTVVTNDGNVLGTIALGGDMIIGVCEDRDGIPTVVYNDLEHTYTAHIEGLELIDKQECSRINSSAYTMCAGFGDYTLAADLGQNLCGLKDGKWIDISTNLESDIEFYTLYSIAMTGEDEFAAVQYQRSSSKLILLTVQDISELKSKQVVTLACFTQGRGLGQYDDEIKAFNAESEDYRIEYRNYWNADDLERDHDQLRLDIISGSGLDIIPFDSDLTVDSFNSGTFCDLYEFIDNEPDLSREDFIPNVREAFERDGKMVMIAPSFGYQTTTAKAGYPGVRENWSIDDMIEAYDSTPEGMYFFSRYENINTRQSYFDETVKDYFFIDYDKAECHFDSPEFIKLLNFFNDNEIGLTWDEYNNLSGDFHCEDTTFDILDGKKFVDFEGGGMQWFGAIFNDVRANYEDECVFVGFPYDGEKSGSYINIGSSLGIAANSLHKEGAWSFLRYMVSDEYYHDKNGMHYYCFPVIESIFDEKAQMTVDGMLVYPTDENGKIIDGDMIRTDWTLTRYDMEGNKIMEKTLEPFTQEECDHYKDMIKNSEVIRYDNTIYQIILEETMPFFNYECTAEDCAEKIQDRVSLYLSERYG
ncbi:MAG: carbohydrate ABC transporter substrate-binding protein [Ruminococcus sp.]|nr:carbohydrate ABC transporter substrate-binding protein [Ruminococcus sp.]